MSVIQSFDELESREAVIALARANPHHPRILGIDVGQRNLAIWMGMPRVADERAATLAGVRFHWLGWAIIHCSATQTAAEACRLVLRALDTYRRSMFALASDIVIEKQHKRNRRMRIIARAIRAWVLREVPHASSMRIVERQAMHKFANVAGMPCPMPRDYAQRKQASLNVVQRQTQQWAGQRWWTFLRTHLAAGDDLADAALIAQDWAVNRYLLVLVATSALDTVSQELLARRHRNTWRKKQVRSAARGLCSSSSSSSHDVTFSDDSDSSGDDDVDLLRETVTRKRRLTDEALISRDAPGLRLDDEDQEEYDADASASLFEALRRAK